jgi:hypothetical protein
MGKINPATAVAVLPTAALTTTTTGSAVDKGAYVGEAAFILASGAGGAGATMDVKLRHCATSGGSYADITGATFTQVGDAVALEKINVDLRKCNRYIKAVATIAGSASFSCSLTMLATPKVSG